MRTLIIGGVAGGMSAATRLRRLDESMEIVVFERGDYVSFANCGLPYYVGGVIQNRRSLLLQTPESLSSRFALDVRIAHEVTAIDRTAQTLSVTDLATGDSSIEHYDRLILAGGASADAGPATDAIPTHTLRSIADVDRITEVLGALDSPGRAVVVGGGFIGLEAVENLVARGLQVTLVQRAPQLLAPLDPEMAAPVVDVLRNAGVDVRLSTGVVSAADGVVTLDDGSTVAADLVISGTGVHPETSLAVSAGLSLGPTGGIAVDDRQRTSDEHIFAVGDGVEKIDGIDGSATLVSMAGLANRHGRAAADAIAGESEPAEPALGTAIVGVLGITVAMTGWSEKRLVAAGRAHRVIHTHPADHATYYPGSQVMAIKLLVDPDTDAILGAQIVGGAGVDKRIDVIVTAMAGGLSASALSRLELAYAPQFGAAKDAVNMAGYVADNLHRGATRAIQWHELGRELANGAALVDVRTAKEFAAGAIPGSINIALDDLRARHTEIPNGRVIVHCQVGQRGHTAARLLTQLGHEVVNLDGGYRTWKAGVAASA